MESCLLCLEIKTTSEEAIKVNSMQWQELNVQNIIEKHLWPMPAMKLTSWLCIKCWQQLDDFHKFYIRIEYAQIQLGTTMKIEISNDTFDPQQILKTEETIKEPVGIMALENVKDLWDDDKPLKQKCSRKRKNNDIPDAKEISTVTTKISHTPGNNAQVVDINDIPMDDKSMDEFIAKNIKITCPFCKHSMKSFLDLSNHCTIEHEKRAYAVCCKKKSYSRHRLFDHLQMHTDPNFLTCKECKEQFVDSLKLKNHIKKEHAINQEPKPTTDDKAIEKYIAENFTITCFQCQLPMATFQELCDHGTKEHEERAYVTCCNLKFYTRNRIYDHLQSHSDPNFLKCQECGEQFFDGIKFRIHIQKHNKNNKKLLDANIPMDDVSIDKYIAENLTITCFKCHMPMATFQDLSDHCTKDHQERAFVTCCNHNFFARNRLFDHLQHHSDPNNLKCTECGKLCSDSIKFKNHMKMHDRRKVDEKKYCCEICGKQFRTSCSIINHKTRHLPDEEKMFPCPKCNKRFGNRWILSCHVKNIHESSTNCDICGQTLVNKSALNIHKRIKHSVEEPKEYDCSICSKTFKGEHKLKRHIKHVHQTGFIYKCTMCTKAFKRKRALTEHMAVHAGTPLYTCPFCPKTFNCHSNIAKHRRKWHPEEEENRKKSSETCSTACYLNIVGETSNV